MFEVNATGQLILTRELKLLLNKIQRDGNRDVKYQTDIQTYRTEEYWAYPKKSGFSLVGDCEDIALYKHRLLVAAGCPQACLLLTICTDPQNQGHCVLSVVTDKRDYILCNQHPDVATPIQMRHEGYVFLYRQQFGQPIDAPWDIIQK